jgi:hypothetical protein
MQMLIWGADGWPQPGSDLPAGRYTIVSKASGLALGVQNSNAAEGTLIDQAPYMGGPTQQWNLSPTGDGYYSIGSLGTAKYFDLLECKSDEGTKISQYPWFNNDCQKCVSSRSARTLIASSRRWWHRHYAAGRK